MTIGRRSLCAVRKIAFLLAAALLTAAPASFNPCGGAAFAQSGCCKRCSAGKACGDSCIARHLTCHKGKGCACNA
jgi:hypothetical protein